MLMIPKAWPWDMHFPFYMFSLVICRILFTPNNFIYFSISITDYNQVTPKYKPDTQNLKSLCGPALWTSVSLFRFFQVFNHSSTSSTRLLCIMLLLSETHASSFWRVLPSFWLKVPKHIFIVSISIPYLVCLIVQTAIYPPSPSILMTVSNHTFQLPVSLFLLFISIAWRVFLK